MILSRESPDELRKQGYVEVDWDTVPPSEYLAKLGVPLLIASRAPINTIRFAKAWAVDLVRDWPFDERLDFNKDVLKRVISFALRLREPETFTLAACSTAALGGIKGVDEFLGSWRVNVDRDQDLVT